VRDCTIEQGRFIFGVVALSQMYTR